MSMASAVRPVITIDVDWAPDFMIDFVAERLVSAGVRATWFVTHASPALARLRSRADLFELGLHPNFLPGSTHGATPEQVLAHCRQLVPEARSVRMHGLFQSSNLLEQIAAAGLTTDVSLFLPHARRLEPAEYFWPSGIQMLRLPYGWEDDFEMARPAPAWDPARFLEGAEGMQIFGFHPVHVFLNSADLAPYRRLKERGNPATIAEAEARDCVYRGTGAGTAFESLVGLLARRSTFRIADIGEGR